MILNKFGRGAVCKFGATSDKIKNGAKMKRRDFIKGAATCAVGFATAVNLFAEQTGQTSAANLTDAVAKWREKSRREACRDDPISHAK